MSPSYRDQTLPSLVCLTLATSPTTCQVVRSRPSTAHVRSINSARSGTPLLLCHQDTVLTIPPSRDVASQLGTTTTITTPRARPTLSRSLSAVTKLASSKINSTADVQDRSPRLCQNVSSFSILRSHLDANTHPLLICVPLPTFTTSGTKNAPPSCRTRVP